MSRARRSLSLLLIVVAAACGDDLPNEGSEQAVVTSVEVSPASARVVVPGTATLTATVKDQNDRPMTGQAVAWSTGNPTVATVDGSGGVTVIAAGEATITATAAGKSGTAQVTGVMPVASIKVSPDSLVLTPGQTVQLSAALADAAGNPLTGRPVTWVSSAPTSATVSGTGLVTALASGEVAITASVEGVSGAAHAFVGRNEQQLPAPTCTNCLEIVPSSVTLTTTGDQQLLQAYRVDASGRRTLVQATWQSSAPGSATVNADGLVTAVAPLGSARITAIEGGLTAAPALVVMISPAPGALLVSDADVVGDPVAVDESAPFGKGFRYRVRLRKTPTIGQIVLAAEQAPVAGRVVSVTAGADGTSEVVLEAVPISALVTGLSINETIALPATPLSGESDAPAIRRGGGHETKLADDESFPIGPFMCKADVGLNQALLTLQGSISVTPTLTLTFLATGTSVERLTVDGTIAVSGKVEARLPSAIRANVDCKWVIGRIPVPVTGWLAAIVATEVPVGVGFTGVLDIGVGATGADFELQGTASMSIGFICNGSTCPLGGTTTLNLTPSVKPVVPNLSGSARIDVTEGAYVFAELTMAPRLLPSALKVKLIEAKGGVEQKLSLASMAFQQADPAYASGLTIAPMVEIKGGATLEALEGLLEVSLQAFEWKPTFDPIARTPRGTLTITPRVAAGTEQSLGETATFMVSLDPVTFFGSYAVESVEIRWLRENGSGAATLENGRPGCTSLVPSGTGQQQFTCQTDFLEADAGDQTFYAFARVKVGGVTLPVPVEIGTDAKATVEVARVIVQISPKPVTLAPGSDRQFQASVTGTSNTAVTWTATGGTISGSGRYVAGNTTGTFRVIATSNAFPDKADTASVTISGTALSLTGFLPNGTEGAAYNGSVNGVGGGGSYQYASLGGRPPGLSLSASSGTVTGTPTQAGSYNWTIQVSSAGQTASRTFPITIGTLQTIDPLLGPGGAPSQWVMNIFHSQRGRVDVPFFMAKGTQGPNRYQMMFDGNYNCFILLSNTTLPSEFTGTCLAGVSIQQQISGSIGAQDGSGFMKPASGVAYSGSFTLTRRP